VAQNPSASASREWGAARADRSRPAGSGEPRALDAWIWLLAPIEVRLEASALIGDRWVDVAAARGAGVPGVLLERAYSWGPSGGMAPPADLPIAFRAPTLAACVDFVLRTVR